MKKYEADYSQQNLQTYPHREYACRPARPRGRGWLVENAKDHPGSASSSLISLRGLPAPLNPSASELPDPWSYLRAQLSQALPLRSDV